MPDVFTVFLNKDDNDDDSNDELKHPNDKYLLLNKTHFLRGLKNYFMAFK